MKKTATANKLTKGQDWRYFDIIFDLKLPKDRVCNLGGASYDYLVLLQHVRRKALKEGRRPERQPTDDLNESLRKGIEAFLREVENELKKIKK